MIVRTDPSGGKDTIASGLSFPTATRCSLNRATGLGLCTFSGGTGKFSFFKASIDVSPPTDGVNWHWDGTYSFRPQD
jgi:hypothetical protein